MLVVSVHLVGSAHSAPETGSAEWAPTSVAQPRHPARRFKMKLQASKTKEGALTDDRPVEGVNDGRIDAAVGLNRARDVRRVMPLIKSRRVVDLEQLVDEGVDLRSLHASP